MLQITDKTRITAVSKVETDIASIVERPSCATSDNVC